MDPELRKRWVDPRVGSQFLQRSVSPILQIYFFGRGNFANYDESGRVKIFLLTTGRIASSFLWVGSGQKKMGHYTLCEPFITAAIEYMPYALRYRDPYFTKSCTHYLSSSD